MMRSAVLAAVVLAVMTVPAGAATEVNVVPHGQGEPGVPWAALTGMLPPQAQALMYDRLTPLGADVPDAALTPSQDGSGYFKSARLLATDDPSFLTDETVSGHVRGTDGHGADPARQLSGCRTCTRPATTASCSARATSSPRIASCSWSRRAAPGWPRRSACRRERDRAGARGRELAAAQGTAHPELWRIPVRTIAFTPLPLVPLRYTNRPTGIHQVFRFG